MAENEKKPLRGILKNSSSFDKADNAENVKEMKWDEMNILATYHPPDKEYGHMKIDEPKTPYSYEDENAEEKSSEDHKALDAQVLSKKLEGAHPRIMNLPELSDESSEEEDNETEEEKAEKRAFEQKRKMHYNEFHAIKLARQLMDHDEDEEEEEEETSENSSKKETEKKEEIPKEESEK